MFDIARPVILLTLTVVSFVLISGCQSRIDAENITALPEVAEYADCLHQAISGSRSGSIITPIYVCRHLEPELPQPPADHLERMEQISECVDETWEWYPQRYGISPGYWPYSSDIGLYFSYVICKPFDDFHPQ